MAHRQFTLNILLAAACYGCSPCGEPTRTSPDDMVAVARLMVTLDRVMSEEDLETFAALVAEDAVYMLPTTAAIVGQRAIIDHYRQLFDRSDIEITHEPLEIDVAGDFIIHRGNALGTRTLRPAGSPVPFSDKYLFVIKRQPDGSLLVWRAIFTNGG
jgi:ketosteroid isomerase-like protein